MKADPKGVLVGTHVLNGNEACAEGALAAGCRFLGVYPIVPALQVVSRYAQRCLDVDATFVQMEDEISALAAVLGSSWTGRRSMTATSGPGLSLMMEHMGLGIMLETPCVIVDVQHAGPGIGIPGRAAQGDVMQARWGSHGDYELIALAPSTPQEMFDYTIKAFNLSERYRIPVVVLADEYVASMKEEVVIPPAEQIELEQRRYFKGKPGDYLPYKRDEDHVPPMVDIGQGFRFHVTGLTHDDRGYPVMNEECQEYNVHPLMWKIRQAEGDIVEVKEAHTTDADIIVVSYGSTTKAALKAMEKARSAGIKAGSMKLITVWPFPGKRIAELAGTAKAIIVPEMNNGQIVREVERCAHGKTRVVFVPHGDEGISRSGEILSAIEHAAQ